MEIIQGFHQIGAYFIKEKPMSYTNKGHMRRLMIHK